MNHLFERLSRREFILGCTAALSALSLENRSIFDVAEAAESIVTGKAPVAWITAQYCGACLDSTDLSRDPGFASLILESISLRTHPTISALGGDDYFRVIDRLSRQDFILMVEGSLPVKDDEKLCFVGINNNKPVTAYKEILELAKEAKAVLAVGTCASFGGVNRNDNNTVLGLQKALGNNNIINIPGCPPHPDWIVQTLMHLVLEGEAPKLDEMNRPLAFYGSTIHDQCQRRSAFEDGHFANDLGRDALSDKCLYKKGCKGPITHGDCPSRLWNEGASWCVASGGLCVGCTQPEFMRDLAPLHHRLPDVQVPKLIGTRVAADRIGMGMGIVTAAGIVAHMIGKLFVGAEDGIDKKER